MTISQNEREQVLQNFIRCNIDLNQAANYILNHKYDEGCDNLLFVVNEIKHILETMRN